MLFKPQKLPAGTGLADHLEFYPIPAHTEEWHAFRQQMGIGGSEIGYSMGLSKYTSSIGMYYEKLGREEPWTDENEAMFHGKIFENWVGKVWKYYDGTPEGYIKNYYDKKPVRKSIDINGYIRNPKYPHLFASLDNLIIKGQNSLITGEGLLEKPGVLEIKNISSHYARLWESGIPPQYLAQVHLYMIVCELDYAEIAMLRDGRWIEVQPIKRSEAFCRQILAAADAFWNGMVVPARKLIEQQDKHEADGRVDLAEECEAQIQMLEPPPDDSDAYKEFLASKQLFDPIQKQGGPEAYAELVRYTQWHEAAKVCASEKQLSGNRLRSLMLKANADVITFDDGKVTMMAKKGSEKLSLSPKMKP